MKKTLANLVSVVGGEAMLRLANLFTLIVIARLYGPWTLGVYATALAFATVATLIADNGLQVTAVTEINNDPKSTNSIVYGLYVAKLVLMVPVILALVLISYAYRIDHRLLMLGGLVVARTVLQSFAQLHLAILKSVDQMASIGPMQAVHFVFLIGGVSVVYFESLSVYALFAWLLTGQVLELGLSGSKILNSGIRPARRSLRECFIFAKRSTPVGITYGIANLILRTDVIVLATVASPTSVGRFAAAHMLLTFVYAVSWLSGSVWLPELVRMRNSGPEFQRFVTRWTSVIFMTVIPCSFGLFLIAPSLVPTLYGAEFAEAGKILAVLAAAIPFIPVNALYLNRAIALSERSVFLRVYTGTAIATIILDLSLQHVFGAVGIATAIVVREILMFLTFRLLAGHVVRSPRAGENAVSETF